MPKPDQLEVSLSVWLLCDIKTSVEPGSWEAVLSHYLVWGLHIPHPQLYISRKLASNSSSARPPWHWHNESHSGPLPAMHRWDQSILRCLWWTHTLSRCRWGTLGTGWSEETPCTRMEIAEEEEKAKQPMKRLSKSKDKTEWGDKKHAISERELPCTD